MLSIDEIREHGVLHHHDQMPRMYEHLPPDHQPFQRRPQSSSPATAASAASARRRPKNTMPNLFDYKLHRYFDYEPLSEEAADARRDRHPPRAEHVRELSVLVYLFHETRLPGGPLPGFHEEDLRAGHRIHPERIRVLSGEAGPRTCTVADQQGREDISSTRPFPMSAMSLRRPTTTTTVPSSPPTRRTSRTTWTPS